MEEASTELVKGSVYIPISSLGKSITQQGDLTVPSKPKGIILFAHGSGSGRNSPRNKFVAEMLNRDGLATLLVDLLTPEEEESDTIMEKQRDKISSFLLNKFNIRLLAIRLVSITEWVTRNPNTRGLLLGYFGASIDTAAALIATATSSVSNFVAAIVSRSGRPDLVQRNDLNQVRIPTLFIVGSNDFSEVIDWNRNALRDIASEKKKMVIVANASHLFEEPGTLEEVAKLASGWFRCFFQIEDHKLS